MRLGLAARPPAVVLGLRPPDRARSGDRAQRQGRDQAEKGEELKGKKHGRKHKDSTRTASKPRKEDQEQPKGKRPKGRKGAEAQRTTKQGRSHASEPVAKAKGGSGSKRRAKAKRR
ncbi:MAG: hypothetical protein HY898_18825 [Deltaproteobacteria bacterium]|nr:hypothetical protein [Deltaproteobacteria bacterium]